MTHPLHSAFQKKALSTAARFSPKLGDYGQCTPFMGYIIICHHIIWAHIRSNDIRHQYPHPRQALPSWYNGTMQCLQYFHNPAAPPIYGVHYGTFNLSAGLFIFNRAIALLNDIRLQQWNDFTI